MNVLIISYNIPYPLNNGGAIAQYFFLEKNIGINYTFITNANNTIEYKRVQNLIKNHPHIKFRVFRRYSYFQYLIDLLRKSINKFPKIHSAFSDFFKNQKNTEKNEDILFAAFINKYLNENDFDWIQYEFFEAINLVNLTESKIKKIAIVHEIRSKRIELEGGQSNEYLENLRKKEFSTLNKVNRVVVFNKLDIEYLKLYGVHSKIIYSPFSIPEKLVKKQISYRSINHFLFLGSQFHSPNEVGLMSFLNNIYLNLPNELQLPIYIVGEWKFDFTRIYQANSNIKFLGNLTNLDDVFNDSILICPILSGSGIRTKILESLFKGAPVISTSIGSEGLYDDINNKHIFIYQDITDFISCLQKLLNFTKADFEKFNKNISHYLNENFEYNSVVKKRLNCYE